MSTKSHMVPFWTWNKRESRMTMTPGRVASGKAPLARRVLQSLSGVRLYRKLEKHIAKSKRDQRNADIYQQKFGRKSTF